MSKKLFVGSLSWNTNDDELRRAFEEFGEVTDTAVISDRETGRSRGFGFVTFADAQSADSAIEKMNGTMLDGRTINVNEAKERAPRGGGGGGAARCHRIEKTPCIRGAFFRGLTGYWPRSRSAPVAVPTPARHDR
jgi:RNA recognition motif-containing protein